MTGFAFSFSWIIRMINLGVGSWKCVPFNVCENNFYSIHLAFFTSFCISQGTAVNIIVGSHVWAEDASVAWIDGQVSKINGEEVEIQATDGKKVNSAHTFSDISYLNKSTLFSYAISTLIPKNKSIMPRMYQRCNSRLWWKRKTHQKIKEIYIWGY